MRRRVAEAGRSAVQPLAVVAGLLAVTATAQAELEKIDLRSPSERGRFERGGFELAVHGAGLGLDVFVAEWVKLGPRAHLDAAVVGGTSGSAAYQSGPTGPVVPAISGLLSVGVAVTLSLGSSGRAVGATASAPNP